MRPLLAAAASVILGGAASAAAPDLYDWMGPASNIVVAEIVTDDGRWVEARAMRVLRGSLSPEARVPVDLRGANRDRTPGTPALELLKGRRYILLLEPGEERRARSAGAFVIVRGPAGAREIPLEGGDALESAVVLLAAIQNLKDLEGTWRRFAELLSDPNPFLAETALDQHLKFRRGGASVLGPARELLGNPRPAVRVRAAALCALVLSKGGATEEAETALLEDLVAAARRDPDPAVRAAATRALGSSLRPAAEEALRAIARDDPEQSVRYAAERELFERSARGGRAD